MFPHRRTRCCLAIFLSIYFQHDVQSKILFAFYIGIYGCCDAASSTAVRYTIRYYLFITTQIIIVIPYVVCVYVCELKE